MAEPISLPAGAFAAAKAGKPQPAPAPKPEAKAADPAPQQGAKPKTELRKAGTERKEPEIVRKQAPQLRNEDSEPAEGEGAPEGMTAAQKKIWKLKADGEDFDFDATDEEAVKREIMKARGADKRFQAAAQMRKEAESAFSALKDPARLKQILQDPRVGVDIKKFAEDMVWENIQQQQREEEWAKDPAAKQRYEDEQELRARREADARSAEEGKTRKQREDQARYETGYETKILKALDVGGIPKTPEAISRMAEYLMKSVEHGYDLSAEDLVQQVRDDYISEFTAVLGAADGDQLLALLGEENAKKLREADLRRLKNPQGNPFPSRSPQKTAASGRAQPAPKKQAGSEWRQDLMKDFLNRKR